MFRVSNEVAHELARSRVTVIYRPAHRIVVSEKNKVMTLDEIRRGLSLLEPEPRNV